MPKAVAKSATVARCVGGAAMPSWVTPGNRTTYFYMKLQYNLASCTPAAAVFAEVDASRRSAIQAHHSATHLLHKALRDVLGPHVKQRGSLVLPDRLRFDFAHYAALSADEIRAAEQHVLARVVGNAAAEVTQSSMDEAVARGAMAFLATNTATSFA